MRGHEDVIDEELPSACHVDDYFLTLQWAGINTVLCSVLDALPNRCHQIMMNHTATLSILADMVVPFC